MTESGAVIASERSERGNLVVRPFPFKSAIIGRLLRCDLTSSRNRVQGYKGGDPSEILFGMTRDAVILQSFPCVSE
ncbi:MAG: hypothetical protein ACPL1K_04355 [Candidatus Kryptoniota bacterium]